ncbi:MAG: hypothetical protein IPJ01_10580 [Micavibrio sp.]|nr:hypothetical protein [Micavibrio sp.]
MKLSLKELRKEKKLFYSDCCKAKFKANSNGLYTYYVCDMCENKTEPINGKGKTLDLHGEIKNIKSKSNATNKTTNKR